MFLSTSPTRVSVVPLIAISSASLQPVLMTVSQKIMLTESGHGLGEGEGGHTGSYT